MLKILFSCVSIFAYLIIGIQACIPSKSINSDQSSSRTILDFCKIPDGSELICKDNAEGFFEHINELDIAIQMQEESDFPSKQEALNAYKDFLKGQVLDFTSYEITYLLEILNRCVDKIQELNTDLLPDTIHLIKTDGSGYGHGVFYTRENSIIIPSDELGESWNEEKSIHLESVMYHEIFHIISRNRPTLRSLLYKQIGFQKLEAKLIIPESLGSRKLLNPDGIDISYFIKLNGQNDQDYKLAVPVIRSNSDLYDPEKPLFFSYMDFDLYEILQTDESVYSLICDPLGKSLLEDAYKADFFSQILDNTDYIIHPDEIMADNFTYCLQINEGTVTSNFSEKGSQLILTVKNIISAQ